MCQIGAHCPSQTLLDTFVRQQDVAGDVLNLFDIVWMLMLVSIGYYRSITTVVYG